MSVLLETKRLLLRPPRAADISQFLPLINDYDVAKNLSRVSHPYTEDDACSYMVLAANGWAQGDEFLFAALRKSDAAYLGMCGFHPAHGSEIGYWLGSPYWGQGFATEAVAALLAFAFMEKGAERLVAKWFHGNPASGRVLEKLSFAHAGEEMSNCLARGHTVPCHVTALDRAAYMTRKKTP